MSSPEIEPQSASELAKQLVEILGTEGAVRAVIGVSPDGPWSGPRPHVSWEAFKKATDALGNLLRRHGAALDLLLPNAGLVLAEARQLLTRRATNPTAGASVVWHAQSLVQIWCFVEQIAIKGEKTREQIIRDAAKRGYSVQVMVSSPRPRSAKGKKINSAVALTKAYQKAAALLASVPEARGFFHANVEAFHETTDRGEGYRRLVHQKLLAAGLASSERPDAISYQHQHWIKRLEEVRREQASARLRPPKAK